MRSTLSDIENLGWDVNQKGLNGAPKIRLITHDQIHGSIKKNLVLLGLGYEVCSEHQAKIARIYP